MASGRTSTQQHAAPEARALSGLTVVEWGNFISGPYCARLLADAGARVIKVEPPDGDEARGRGPFPNDVPDPDRSGLFIYLNTGKQGMTLDLARIEARSVFLDLLKNADVLVENGPPGALDEMGLGYATLHSQLPGLVVTSITPFGLTGPYRDYAGDDLIAMNMGGLAYATPGLPDHLEDPMVERPLRPATYLSDFLTGLSGAVATFLALFSRRRDGMGRHVDISQLEAVASMMTWDVAHHSYLGFSKPRFPTVQAGVAPNIYMPCKDGYVVLVAFSDYHWERLVEVMGSPEWAETELFQETFSRAQYWDALGPLLLEWTMSHSGREICELTLAEGLPCFPAYEIAEMVGSEQALARGSFVDMKADGMTWRMPRPPFLSSEGPRYSVTPAPKLGQHTHKILCDLLGYDESTIAGLRSQGVI